MSILPTATQRVSQPRVLTEVQGLPLPLDFKLHSHARLRERYQLNSSDVSPLFADGVVFARSYQGVYAVEVTGPALGDRRMIAVLAHPNYEDASSAAVITFFPEWDGDMSSPHIDILREHACIPVKRRPLVEVLNERLAA